MRTNSKTTTAVVSAKNAINKPIIWAIGIVMIISLFVGNFAKGQIYNDITPAKDPCPPGIEKSQPQVKKNPGTNGVQVECNPKIDINSIPACYGVGVSDPWHYVPAESTSMYRGWDMVTSGGLFLIIGFIFGYLLRHHAGNGNGGSGHTNTFSPTFNPTIRVVARTGDTVDFMVAQEKNPENKG